MAELDTVQRFTSGLPDVLVIVNNRMLDSFCFCPRKKKKKKSHGEMIITFLTYYTQSKKVKKNALE